MDQIGPVVSVVIGIGSALGSVGSIIGALSHKKDLQHDLFERAERLLQAADEMVQQLKKQEANVSNTDTARLGLSSTRWDPLLSLERKRLSRIRKAKYAPPDYVKQATWETGGFVDQLAQVVGSLQQLLARMENTLEKRAPYAAIAFRSSSSSSSSDSSRTSSSPHSGGFVPLTQAMTSPPMTLIRLQQPAVVAVAQPRSQSLGVLGRRPARGHAWVPGGGRMVAQCSRQPWRR